jgi:hypothetical protein
MIEIKPWFFSLLDAKVNATAASPPPASVQPECAPFPEAGALAAVALVDDVGVLQYAASFAVLLLLLVAVAAVLAVLWAVRCIRRVTTDYKQLEETYKQSAEVFGKIGAAMETIDGMMGTIDENMETIGQKMDTIDEKMEDYDQKVGSMQGVNDRAMDSIKQQMATHHLSVQNLVCTENDAILEIGQGLKDNKAELEGILAVAVKSLERKLEDAVQTLGTKLDADADINMPISQLVTERLFTEQAPPSLQQAPLIPLVGHQKQPLKRASHSGIPRVV